MESDNVLWMFLPSVVAEILSSCSDPQGRLDAMPSNLPHLARWILVIVCRPRFLDCSWSTPQMSPQSVVLIAIESVGTYIGLTGLIFDCGVYQLKQPLI